MGNVRHVNHRPCATSHSHLTAPSCQYFAVRSGRQAAGVAKVKMGLHASSLRRWQSFELAIQPSITSYCLTTQVF